MNFKGLFMIMFHMKNMSHCEDEPIWEDVIPTPIERYQIRLTQYLKEKQRKKELKSMPISKKLFYNRFSIDHYGVTCACIPHIWSITDLPGLPHNYSDDNIKRINFLYNFFGGENNFLGKEWKRTCERFQFRPDSTLIDLMDLIYEDYSITNDDYID